MRPPIRRRHRFAVLLALLLLPLTAIAAPETAEEIDACVRANAPEKSSVQTVEIEVTNRVGDSSRSIATIHWMGFDDGLSKALLRYERPLDMRGAGVLLLEQEGRSPDTFLYLPDVGQVRRVSSRAASSSLFGTDFSYEDFNRLVGMAGDADKSREADTVVDGREAFVLTLRPTPEAESSYERIVTTVDKATCVALRTESFEPGDRLRKVMTADAASIEQVGKVHVPRKLRMQDVRDQTHTDVLVEDVEIEADIKPKMFSARELEAGAR